MEHDFWHQRWASNEIGFHQPDANPLLLKHFPALGLAKGSVVFVPLCGKTLDIGWLLSQGYMVIGAELNESAIGQLFDELGIAPQISDLAALRLYRGPNLSIFVGDFFALRAEQLGPLAAIYDRAALIALPAPMRLRYAEHLLAICGPTPQLLICIEYDQSRQAGPPFSVDATQVQRLYAAAYSPRLLERQGVEGGLKGKCAADEAVWHLVPST